jgi:cytochrome c-type biogenesis protein CcmE
MTRKQRRLILIGSSLGVLALAAVLVLSALKDSIVFFNSPTDVVEKHVQPGSRMRLGGLVKEGTVQRGDNLAVRFEVTDGNRAIMVSYQGILPDLFREADSVLAKHDENYMPKEVVDALKKQGRWEEGNGKKK